MFRLSIRITIILLSIILIVVLLILPINLPYSIEAPGKVLPSREWIISKSTGGQLITVIKDNVSGISRNYSVSEFERGDAIQLSINNALTLGSTINSSDTIGSVISNELQLQLVRLNGELQTAKANLELNITGEKESIVKEAEEKLSLMKKQAEEQHKIFDRQKAMFEKDLISEEEYEIGKSTTELSDINISIADAQLKSVKSGSKQEQVDFIKSQIASLEDEIEIIKNRLSDYNLVAPFSGVINQMSLGDTLIVVADTSEYVVIIPVRWQERLDIEPGLEVTIKAPSGLHKVMGSLNKISKDVRVLNGNQVIFTSALAKDYYDELAPGLMVQCKINCGQTTVAEYLEKTFNSFFGL